MVEGEGRYQSLILLASLLWGTSFVAAKIGLEHVDPFLYTLIRFLLGSALLFLVMFTWGGFEGGIMRSKLVWGVAFVNACAYELQHLGISMTTATNSVLLVDINVIFVALIAALVLGERISARIGMGMALGLTGVIIVTTEGNLSNLLSGGFMGNLAVFISGLLWAFYIVYQKKMLIAERNVLMVTTAVILATSVFLLPMSALLIQDYDINFTGWMSVLYTGIFCSGIAFLAYNAGLRRVGATSSSILLLMEIVFGVLFAFIFLTEVPTAAVMVGGTLIVLAIIVITLRGRRVSGH